MADGMSAAEKMRSKFTEQPLVPLGCALTAAVLVGGVVSFKRGNKELSQKMMRARVAAQTGTLAALGYGAYASSLKKNQVKAERAGNKV